MSREPQTLVWLPTLHRLIATETGAYSMNWFDVELLSFSVQFVMKLNAILVKSTQSLACGERRNVSFHWSMEYIFSIDSYRCLRCFNYDLCQTCFFTGDHTKNHDGSHPIEEYCKQVCWWKWSSAKKIKCSHYHVGYSIRRFQSFHRVCATQSREKRGQT